MAERELAYREMWEAPDIVPSITYADLSQAVEWLERVFGFRERVEARLTWPGGGMTWIEIGTGLLHIARSAERQGVGGAASSFTLKVYVDDLDGHFARAKAEGANIILAPEDGFWGGRIYRALDHEGHLWEISQGGRDLAAHRWQLPPGVTRGVAK